MCKERGIVEIQGTHFRPLFRMYFICGVQELTYYNTPVPWGRAQKVSDFLFKTIRAICQLYHGENKLHFDDDDSKHLNTV